MKIKDFEMDKLILQAKIAKLYCELAALSWSRRNERTR